MMSALALVVALSVGQVAGLCGAGKNCRVNTLRTTSGALTTAIAVPANRYIEVGSCTMRDPGTQLNICSDSAYPVRLTGTLFTTTTAQIYGSFLQVWGSSTFTTSSPSTLTGGTGYVIATDNQTNQVRLGHAVLNRFRPIGSAPHPVLDMRTFVFGWSDGATRGWEGAPGRTGAGTLPAITTTCVGGTTAEGSQQTMDGSNVQLYAFTTAAVINSFCNQFYDGQLGKPYTYIREWNGNFALSATTSIIATWGLNSSPVLFTGPTAAPVTNGAWYRYDTGSSDVNFMACQGDGSAAACTSTGVAADTSPHTFEISFRESGYVLFFVDGVLRVRSATYAPSSGTDLYGGQGVKNLSAAARALSVGRWSFSTR